MQNTVREDRAKQILDELDKAYKSLVWSPRKPWLNAEDKTEINRELERSLKSAQAAVELIDAQPGISPELKRTRDQIVILSTLSESDLKTTRENL